MTTVECGAACLAMVLSHHGRKTSVAECRENCEIGRDGVRAESLARAAISFGLEVKAYSGGSEGLRTVPLPLIAHWNSNHFVVVEDLSDHQVRIVDPAAGRRLLSPGEFGSGFTGIALVLEPGPGFQRRNRRSQTLWINYLRSMLGAGSTARTLLHVLAASLMLQLLGLVFPLATKLIVDHVLPRRLDQVMPAIGVGLLAFVVAQASISYLRSVLMINLRARLDSDLMTRFLAHLLSLPFSFFQHRPTGDLLMRLGSNSLIRDMLTSQILAMLLDSLFLVVYLVMLIALEPVLALMVSSVGALQILVLLAGRNRIRDLTRRDLAARSEEQSYLVEAINGIAVLKSSGAEGRAFDRWSRLFAAQLDTSVRRSRFSAVLEAAFGTLRTASPLLLLWAGAFFILDGRTSLGTVLAVNALAAALLSPLTTLVSGAYQLQMVGASLERVADVLESEPEQHPRHPLRSDGISGRIELRNVSFRYDAASEFVVYEATLKLAPGQKVAIVGPTGSGKTTLAMLLLGLLRPTTGQVLFDDIPLEEFDVRSLRDQIGVVLQEPFLFSASIRDNIALTNPDIEPGKIIAAAKMAGIHNEISRMPMGYETLVAEGGSALSGGQRQRLAIARALVRRPPVLLLDEATSHLDAAVEEVVDRNLSALPATRIVIAHRLSTIRNAALILVMDRGRVVERGSHDELIALGGFYTKLAGIQLESEAHRGAGLNIRPNTATNSVRSDQGELIGKRGPRTSQFSGGVPCVDRNTAHGG
jgi:ABC-type bacteriocin/lantibiotic exporter with double-glycine peptidase domain